MKIPSYLKLLVTSVLATSTLGATPLTPAQGKRAVSPLQNLLGVFASRDAASWPSFETVPGLQWRNAKPLDNPDANNIGESVYRSGNLLLSGFGVVDVPDDKIGAEAGARKGNEGDAVVTALSRLSAMMQSSWIRRVAGKVLLATSVHGHPLKVDGDFGPDTIRAVEKFQAELGLLKDGKVSRDTQAALHSALQAKATLSLDEKRNPDNALYGQALAGVRKLDTDMDRASDQHSKNLAAALSVAAKAQGLTRIETVVISEDGSRTFAVQDTSPLKALASVSTAQAVSTSIEQSSVTAHIVQPVPAHTLPQDQLQVSQQTVMRNSSSDESIMFSIVL